MPIPQTNIIGSDDGWAFASKFCFDYNPPESADAAGLLAAQVFTLDAGPPSGNLTMLVYDDEADSWPRIYGRNGLTCAQKSAVAKASYPIAFDANGQWSLPSQFQSVFEHRRPRFWYVVVAHAACQPTGTLSTSIRFVNVGSSPWNQEFGVNERGLNTLYLVYFFVYAALSVYHFYGVRSLVQTNTFHPVRCIWHVLPQYELMWSPSISVGSDFNFLLLF